MVKEVFLWEERDFVKVGCIGHRSSTSWPVLDPSQSCDDFDGIHSVDVSGWFALLPTLPQTSLMVLLFEHNMNLI